MVGLLEMPELAIKCIYNHETCRLDFNFVIKVADFGLSESIDMSKQYFRQDKQAAVRLPFKWMAPESITDGIFSEKTDVVKYKCMLTQQNIYFRVGEKPFLLHVYVMHQSASHGFIRPFIIAE